LTLWALPTQWGAPFLRVFCEGRELEMPEPRWFDHASTTKSNSARRIAPTLANNARMGHLSANGANKIVKGGPPGSPVPALWLKA